MQNSGLQYLSASTDAPETRSPNQHLLPLTAKVNPQDHLEIGGCDVTALVKQ
ncbi:MAG: diaminopimelate decarboxylase, partial [Planktothrix sp.]